MVDKLELISLKGKGRAEAVRLMLVFSECPFTDTRLTISEWKLRKKRGMGMKKIYQMKVFTLVHAPYLSLNQIRLIRFVIGQLTELTNGEAVVHLIRLIHFIHFTIDDFDEETKLPVLIINNNYRVIGVYEISKWVAEKNDLYGGLPGERKAIEGVIETLDELHKGLAPTLRATLTRNYEERRVVWNKFKENTLIPCLEKYEKELSDKMFLVGTSITWADIALIEVLTRYQSCYDSFYLAHFPVLKEYCHRFETLPIMRPYIQTRPETHF